MLSAHEGAAALRDAESEPRRGEIAVEDQQVPGLHTFQNGRGSIPPNGGATMNSFTNLTSLPMRATMQATSDLFKRIYILFKEPLR